MQSRWPRVGRPWSFCLLAGAALSGCGERNAYKPPPLAEVSVRTPDARKITIYREFTGTTQAVKKVDLMARVQGFVEAIDYSDGAKVPKDKLLFQIERAPYVTSLQIAQAAVTQQQALLTQAEADLERQKSLVARQVASESKFDDSLAKRDSTAAALSQAKGQVEQAQINLGYTEVKAPFEGVVSARLAYVGSLVGAGGPTKLATIYQTDPIYVSFNITEQQAILARQRYKSAGEGGLAKINEIPVEIGLQTEAGFPHHGKIDYVSPDLDSATGTFGVRAVLANAQGTMLPGLFVRVRVPVAQDADVLLVPDNALGNDQQGRYVLVVDETDTVVQKRVEIADLVNGNERVIRSGLNPKDRVVVAGMQRAIPASKVKPVQASATASKP